MNEDNKPLIYFWGLIAVATIVIFMYQRSIHPPVTVENNPQVQEQQQLLNVYRDNCARCHGAFGEGFASNPVLRGRNLPLPMVMDRIQKGRGKMPAFPNIQEPILSKLAKFVSGL